MDWRTAGNEPPPQTAVDGLVSHSFTPASKIAQPDAADAADDGPKCCKKGCEVTAGVFPCSASGCTAHIHLSCYDNLCQKHEVPVIEGVYCCTKNCYNEVKKAHGSDVRLTWNNDGNKGTDDPHCSMKILLDWFLTEGNYNKCRGKKNNGKKKKECQECLAKKMSDETKSKRDWKQVERKISTIKEQWRTAHDWVVNAGVGIKEEHGEQCFKEVVRKKCFWCFDLEPIFLSRSSSRPIMTTEDLDDEEEDIDDSASKKSATSSSSSESSSSDASSKSGSDSKGVPNKIQASVKKPPKNTPHLCTPNANGNNSKGKNKRGSGQISLMDEESLSLLVGSREERRKCERKKLRLEQSKVDLEHQRLSGSEFDIKKKNADYALSMIKVCNKLKSAPYLHSDDRILEMSPQMKTLNIIKSDTVENPK